MRFGVATDYEYALDHKRGRLTVWSGPFMSVLEAEAYSLPKGDGYMLHTYNGDKVRVTCPVPRDESNYQEVDKLIDDAMKAYYARD